MINTLITDDRLQSIGRLLKEAPIIVPYLKIAEVGVYKGGSLKFIAEQVPDCVNILGFDTFNGLPGEQWESGEIHNPGDFSDTSFEAVFDFVVKNHPNVRLLRGLFPYTARIYESGCFSFVHIDTDFYLSVKACLDWFWPRIVRGGIMVFDDYGWPNCPGVEKALNDFKEPHNIEILTGAKYQAHIIKP